MEPRYEQDDGVLTDNQLKAIRDLSPATNTPDENFTQRLFPEHKPADPFGFGAAVQNQINSGTVDQLMIPDVMPEDANLPPYED